jgi:hypothetical protein
MSEPQHMVALKRANAVRLPRVAAKQSIRKGELSIGDALRLDCCQTMLVRELLESQFRWGRQRALSALIRLGMSERLIVKRTTERQRGLLEDDLNHKGSLPNEEES